MQVLCKCQESAKKVPRRAEKVPKHAEKVLCRGEKMPRKWDELASMLNKLDELGLLEKMNLNYDIDDLFDVMEDRDGYA